MVPKTNNQTNNQTNSRTNSQSTHPAKADDRPNLSHRYGVIGIQAVAAAARYSDTKPAHAQAIHRIDQRFVESAG